MENKLYSKMEIMMKIATFSAAIVTLSKFIYDINKDGSFLLHDLNIPYKYLWLLASMIFFITFLIFHLKTKIVEETRLELLENSSEDFNGGTLFHIEEGNVLINWFPKTCKQDQNCNIKDVPRAIDYTLDNKSFRIILNYQDFGMEKKLMIRVLVV